MSERILVTGDQGYIGTHLAPMLDASPHTWCGLDVVRNPTQDLRGLQECQEMVRMFEPSVVIHLAAETDAAKCEVEPSAAMTDNVVGTINLLKAATPGVKRFVIASTAMATAPTGHLGVYALSKYLMEAMVRLASHEHGNTEFVILALGNVVGGNHDSETHLVPNLFHALKFDEPFKMNGDPETIHRDFVDVMDVARAFLHFTTADLESVPPGGFHRFEIGSGNQLPIQTVIDFAQKVMGKTVEVERGPVRPGDREMVPLDPIPASRLGFTSKVSLMGSLATVGRYYK